MYSIIKIYTCLSLALAVFSYLSIPAADIWKIINIKGIWVEVWHFVVASTLSSSSTKKNNKNEH